MRSLWLLGVFATISQCEQISEVAQMEAAMANAAMYKQKLVGIMDEAQKKMPPSAICDPMSKSDLLETLQEAGQIINTIATQKMSTLTYISLAQKSVGILSRLSSLAFSFFKMILQVFLNQGEDGVKRTYFKLKTAMDSNLVPMMEEQKCRLETAMTVCESFAKSVNIDLSQPPTLTTSELEKFLSDMTVEKASQALRELTTASGKGKCCPSSGGCLLSCFPLFGCLCETLAGIDCCGWLEFLTIFGLVVTGIGAVLSLITAVLNAIVSYLIIDELNCSLVDPEIIPGINFGVLVGWIVATFPMLTFTASTVAFIAFLAAFISLLILLFTVECSPIGGTMMAILSALPLIAVTVLSSMFGEGFLSAAVKSFISKGRTSTPKNASSASEEVEFAKSFMDQIAPYAEHINQLLADQLNVPVEKISGGTEESIGNIMTAMVNKFRGVSNALPTLQVMQDYFSGLLPTYSESCNPIGGLQQAIQDIVYGGQKCACNPQEETVQLMKSAYSRFQEMAAAKEEIPLLDLSDSMAQYYASILEGHKTQGNQFLIKEHAQLKASQSAEDESKLKIVKEFASANGIAL